MKNDAELSGGEWSMNKWWLISVDDVIDVMDS